MTARQRHDKRVTYIDDREDPWPAQILFLMYPYIQLTTTQIELVNGLWTVTDKGEECGAFASKWLAERKASAIALMRCLDIGWLQVEDFAPYITPEDDS